jgi:hypothetical protein
MVNKVNISSNVIKFPSPFERLKSYTNSPDVMLRKAIITQAIIDATNISEFREIEPSFVVRVTKEIIKLHKSKSSFRKQSQQNSVDSKNKKPLFKTKR